VSVAVHGVGRQNVYGWTLYALITDSGPWQHVYLVLKTTNGETEPIKSNSRTSVDQELFY